MGQYKYNPLVSIIIPVYNGSNYLKEAIDSALNQTYKNIEIIVVNDGSIDSNKTEKIALSYKSKIRYFKKTNGGSSSALNKGIKEMRGEWFSWLSHDDLYYPQKVEEQIKFINENFTNFKEIEKNVFFSASEIINKDGKKLRKPSLKKVLKFGNKINYIKDNAYFVAEPTEYCFHGCSCLINKKVFKEIGFFDEKLKLLNDVDMWYRIYINNYKIYYIPKILVKGRVHKAQISSQIGYSYHNPEQDMFWNRSLNWLLANRKDNYQLFYLYGKNAYRKTRYKEGKKSFDHVLEIGPNFKLKIWITKFSLYIFSNIKLLLKKIYLFIQK